MGGRAIEGAERFDSEEHLTIRAEMLEFFGSHFWWTEGDEYQFVKSYRNKPDHGDLDIVCMKGVSSFLNFEEKLRAWFGYDIEIVKNSDVWSTGLTFMLPYRKVKKVQVDFIFVDDVETASHYFAWNDMGNLFGRVSRRIGLKLGHNGLWYIQRAPENTSTMLKEHLLTPNWDEALEHLGYDVKRYHEGFDSLEDIFEYIMSSRFYDFNKFDLSQRNHKSRIRDEKRPNYRAFLEYATKNPKVYEIDTVENYLTYSFRRFPKFHIEYFEVLEKHNKHIKFKKVYNGEVVSRVTGLEGKELGGFMQTMKRVYSLEECFEQGIDIPTLISELWRVYDTRTN